MTAIPPVVSAQEWQQARDALLVEEKEATRVLDRIAARRRRLPMVEFDATGYLFDSPDGPRTLLDLFCGRNQLVVYQFMDNGPDDFCPGCTHFTNGVVDLEALADAGVSWVTVSNMPLAQIEAYKEKMGWTMPFVSSRGTSFAADCGSQDGFALSVFLRDGDHVYRTYSTTRCGPADVCPEHPRPDSLRTSGGVGRLPGRVAATPHVRLARREIRRTEDQTGRGTK